MLCEGGHAGSGAGRTLLLLCLEVLSQGAPLYTRPSGTGCVDAGSLLWRTMAIIKVWVTLHDLCVFAEWDEKTGCKNNETLCI